MFRRTTKRRLGAFDPATLAAIAVALSVTIPAGAIERDDSRFPSFAPDWYEDAPAYPYGNAAPAPRTDESLRQSGISATYFLPSGGGPGTVGDISLYYAPSEPPSEIAEIDLAAFERLETEMATSFTEAILIPENVEYLAGTDVLKPQPEILIERSILSVTRPTLPCAVDPWKYQFQIALLGSNGYKYLVDLDVNFADRPKGSNCTLEALTDAPDESEEALEPSREITPDPIAKPEPVRDPESASEAPSVESAIEDEREVDWTTILIAAAILAMAIGLVTFAGHRRRKASKRFDGQGKFLPMTPADGRAASRAPFGVDANADGAPNDE